jgi:hypothetical protein
VAGKTTVGGGRLYARPLGGPDKGFICGGLAPRLTAAAVAAPEGLLYHGGGRESSQWRLRSTVLQATSIHSGSRGTRESSRSRRRSGLFGVAPETATAGRRRRRVRMDQAEQSRARNWFIPNVNDL